MYVRIILRTQNPIEQSVVLFNLIMLLYVKGRPSNDF